MNSSKSNGQRSDLVVYAQGTGKVRVNKHENLNLLQHLGEEPLPYDEFILVSHGEAHLSCGEVRAKLFCETTGKFLHDLTQICHRATCPICWDHWVEREVRVASERFIEGFKLLKKENSGLRANHVVFSVPPEEYHLTSKQLRSRLNYRMKKAGVIAAAVVFHPFRFRNIHTKAPVSSWRHCSLNRNAESPVIQSEAYYSPHFHALSVGYLMPSKEFYEKFRWRYYKQNTTDLNNEDRARRMLWYSLSHAGITEGRHALTWTGRFSNNSMMVTHIERETVYPKCPCCGGGIIIEHQPDVIEFIQRPLRMLYSIIITKRHFKFKEKSES